MKFTTILLMALPFCRLVTASPRPADPVVTWEPASQYNSQRDKKREWEGIVCKALKENGCSRGAIVSPEHVSHVGGLRIPHVTVNRDDGKVMHVYKNGAFDSRPRSKPFVLGVKRKEEVEKKRLFLLYKEYQESHRAAGENTSRRPGPPKMHVGIAPIHLPYPHYFIHRPLGETPVAVPAPLPKPWKGPHGQTHVAHDAAGESASEGALAPHEIMVGSMPVSLLPWSKASKEQRQEAPHVAGEGTD